MPAPDDVNARVSAALRELAAVQTVRHKSLAFKRAAATILSLDRPIDTLLHADGSLPAIPNVGPASAKVILDVLRTGASARVEQELASSRRREDVLRARTAAPALLSRAQVRQVLGTPAAPGVVGRDDYRGDLQMHSVWSDGSMTLGALAAGNRKRGYAFCAVTDHTQGLPIAGGMTMAAVARQHKAIDAINRKAGAAFRLIKGAEANILADGALDLDEGDLAAFEIVLAAPHSQLRAAHAQTARLLRAVRTPGVHVLAHPRGRLGSMRTGIVADWDRVFAAAVEANVAVEIDGDPARQDLDHLLAARALAAGCLFALDSDAHSVRELDYAETAIAHARLAGVPAERVINCWPIDRLLAWLDDRRGRRGRA